MKSETLVSDCRNAMLNAVKAHSTWGGLTETQQRDIIDNLQSSAQAIVAEACKLIGERQGEGHRFSRKGVSQTATGSITLKLETAFEHEIWSQIGESSVLLVVPIDPKGHDQGESDEKYKDVQPDQPAMFKESGTTTHATADAIDDASPKAKDQKKVDAKSPDNLPGETDNSEEAPKRGRGRPPKKKESKDQPIAVLVSKNELTDNGIKAVAQLAQSYISAKGLDINSGRDIKMAIADVMADDPLYRPVIDAGNIPEYKIIEAMDIPDQDDEAPAPTAEEAFADEDAFGG